LRLVIFLFSVLITLLLIEVVMRLLPSPTQYRIPKPIFRTSRMPLNSFGYQDYSYSAEKPPHAYRILVVGDSFSLGAAVALDDNYTKKLEQFLNRFGNADGTVYQVLNMSKQGRSTPQEVALAIAQAPRVKADMIIIGYFLNDPEDWDDPGHIKKLWKQLGCMPFKKPNGWRGFLYEHSALAKMLEKRTYFTRAHRGYARYYHELYRNDYSGWEKSQRAFQELGDFARANHLRAGVLIFPVFGHGLGQNYPFMDLHNKLHRAIEDAGLDCLDLLPYFRNQDPGRLVVFPEIDTHPNEVAYRIAAEALWCRIKGYRDSLGGQGKPVSKSVFPNLPPFTAPTRPDTATPR